jgi:hypothetical protein
MERIKLILSIILLVAATSACSAQSTPAAPASTSAPTQILEALSTPLPGKLPLTEAGVPRVSVQDTRAALERGAAVIVDVRSPAAFEASHISGALSIPLGEIETNPTGLNLDKNQWIITYCT